MIHIKNDIGREMWSWANDLFPICRSLTGNGVRQTLAYIQGLLPELKILSVPTGYKAFDWDVPKEWNIKNAYIMDANGNKIIDFKKSNLHVMGYSVPVNQKMSFRELDNYLFSLPEQPDAIPYITSYYKERWGFCIAENQRMELRKNPDAEYHVVIDSSLTPGVLNYGELIIPGESNEEILLSTYVCHPSMANNELSGPVVAIALAQWLQGLPKRRYTYRILFLVETIGSIVYLNQHLDELKLKTKAGFVLSCVGDDRTYSYVPSRLGDTLADKVALHVLKNHAPGFKQYSFLDRGSDERQYCSPGVDLPVCVVCRSKYGEYPEYHTSLDNMSLITKEGLQGSFEIYKKIITILEGNYRYKARVLCEPQLGKRGMYPTVSTKQPKKSVANTMNAWMYADGHNDTIDIAEKIGVCSTTLQSIMMEFVANKLCYQYD